MDEARSGDGGSRVSPEISSTFEKLATSAKKVVVFGRFEKVVSVRSCRPDSGMALQKGKVVFFKRALTRATTKGLGTGSLWESTRGL